ncbi:MAG: hypothetical protein MJA82_12680 [Clostridia bacterium]|nr:hypothetical protein [Clostridia bacterium]
MTLFFKKVYNRKWELYKYEGSQKGDYGVSPNNRELGDLYEYKNNI